MHDRNIGRPHGRAVLLGLFAAAWLAGSGPAFAEDGLEELRKLHSEVTQAVPPISVEAADQAADRLAALNLVAGSLAPDDHKRLRETEVWIALARGDAATALARYDELEMLAPDAPDVAALALVVATAAGHGPLADDAIRRQRAAADAEQNRRLALAVRRLRMVGREAPDVEVSLEEGRGLALRRRGGTALVLDFWALRHRAGPDRFTGLKRLFDAYRNTLSVEFLGVNSDSPARYEEARRFAQEQFGWPQQFEKRTSEAPLTHKGFQTGPPPWQVLLDGEGRVRAVGDANEPGFEYALRAVVAEIAGRFEKIAPRSTDQKLRDRPRPRPAEPRSQRSETPGGPAERSSAARRDAPPEPPPEKPEPPPEKVDQPPPPPPGELPSNADAASLLRQARAYIKTGRRTDARALFEQIVGNYPGTREAKEAQEYLRTMR